MNELERSRPGSTARFGKPHNKAIVHGEAKPHSHELLLMDDDISAHSNPQVKGLDAVFG